MQNMRVFRNRCLCPLDEGSNSFCHTCEGAEVVGAATVRLNF